MNYIRRSATAWTTPAQVRRWFDAFRRTAPGNANHCLRILRQVLNFAIAHGHIDTNPARGVNLNRRPALTRFLSREIGRLYRVRILAHLTAVPGTLDRD